MLRLRGSLFRPPPGSLLGAPPPDVDPTPAEQHVARALVILGALGFVGYLFAQMARNARRPTEPTLRLYAAGSQVELELSSGRKLRSPPAGYALGHDEFGDAFPACNFWLAPVVHGGSAGRYGNRTLLHGIPYWGNGKRAIRGRVAIPRGGWKRLDSVKRILYFFPGYGWCAHPFRRPVSLYQSSSTPRAWRIGLGKGCRADENGFRIP
jgi:hypothetical protein